jgi:hypothetical protein
VSEQRAHRSFDGFGALSMAAGVVVLAAFVWTTGPAKLWEGIRNVGWMFPVIIGLGGLRFFVRAWAWTLCAEPAHPLGLAPAFTAVLAGDAIGNVTPLGPIVGEPAKAALVRGAVPLQPALTALAIENIFYTLSTAAMIVAGTIALLFAFDLPAALPELRDRESERAADPLAFMYALETRRRPARPLDIAKSGPLHAETDEEMRALLRVYDAGMDEVARHLGIPLR